MKEKAKKKSMVNLILSRKDRTFFILNLKLNPKPLDALIVPLKKKLKNVKKGPTQGSICSKSIPAFLVPGPLSKVALSLSTRYV